MKGMSEMESARLFVRGEERMGLLSKEQRNGSSETKGGESGPKVCKQ